MFFSKKKINDQELSEQKKEETPIEETAETTTVEATKEQEFKEAFIRLNADFENYKKRVEKDKTAWMDIAQANILLELLKIVDDFDRALIEHKKAGNADELNTWLEGFEIIRKSLYKFLENNHIQEITQITIFDPNLHEAISQIDSDKHKSDEIIEVIQKGFTFKGSVLRPAKVLVAK